MISKCELITYYKGISDVWNITEQISEIFKFMKIHESGFFLVNSLISEINPSEYLKTTIITVWRPFQG